MNGKPSPETAQDRIADVIKGAAAAEGDAAKTLSPEDLKKLADEIELLKADFGNWESYKAASTDYVKAFTTEVEWHRKIRLGVTVAGALLVLFLGVLLICGVSQATTIFGSDPGHALTALIVGCITGCVIVTIALIKGAFSNVADRNAGLPMPDHMKELVEAGKNILGGMGKS